MAGLFSIVATPIGNREDITLRALRTLKESTVIFCEDTRVTKHLLDTYDIHVPLRRLDAHTENKNIHEVIQFLTDGGHVSLVTDAGTPGISDPGARAVAHVREHFGDSVKIESIPGPSALTALLSVAGLDVHAFTFYGFLPHKKGRQTLFKKMLSAEEVSIFYESPFRLIKALEAIASFDQNARIIVGRELTKFFEEVVDLSVIDMRTYFMKKQIKGELVVIVIPSELR